MSWYRFIHAERATYPTKVLCRVLGVARAGYYAWAHRGVSARARADQELTAQFARIHVQSRRTYGAPRVHAALRASDICCGSRLVARLMRAAGLVGCHRRRLARTTVAEPAAVPAPNLIGRDCDFVAPASDQRWRGGSTYVSTWEGWLYLAVLLDARSRRVVGWAMADHLRAELARDALRMALAARQPAAGLIHHTDRGCQYTAGGYRGTLAARGIAVSMSRADDCYDNALAESCFATLKAELIDTRPWPTRRAARQAIFEWIEVFYNRPRSHSALDYLSPATYEQALAEEAQAAKTQLVHETGLSPLLQRLHVAHHRRARPRSLTLPRHMASIRHALVLPRHFRFRTPTRSVRPPPHALSPTRENAVRASKCRRGPHRGLNAAKASPVGETEAFVHHYAPKTYRSRNAFRNFPAGS